MSSFNVSRLLIVLNGIETFSSSANILSIVFLLIVLNGIETRDSTSETGEARTFNRTKWN